MAACILCVLYSVPGWIKGAAKVESAWVEAIFIIAMQTLVVGILLTYALPSLSNSCIAYPETEAEAELDIEKEKEKQL